MSHLLREHAPITEAGWSRVDDEARERLTPALAARRLIDFSGPHGWQHSATNLGRIDRVAKPPGGGLDCGAAPRPAAGGAARAVHDVARPSWPTATAAPRTSTSPHSTTPPAGSPSPRTRRCSTAGRAAGITGISQASPHDAVALGTDCERYPRHVAKAVEALLEIGIDGPYGLALGPETYSLVLETTEHGGYPLLEHLRKILDGPLVWSPGVSGAVVVSLRGGDFLFESGQDVSVGYDRHDADAVHLYLEESFSFRVVTPEAAVPLTA